MSNILTLLDAVILLCKIANPESHTSHHSYEIFTENKLWAFTRLDATKIIDDGVFHGKLRHRIVVKIICTESSHDAIKKILNAKWNLEKQFGSWGSLLNKAAKVAGDDPSLIRKISKGEKSAEEVYKAITDATVSTATYELASAFLENSGTHLVSKGLGTFLELTFAVDEKVSAA